MISLVCRFDVALSSINILVSTLIVTQNTGLRGINTKSNQSLIQHRNFHYHYRNIMTFKWCQICSLMILCISQSRCLDEILNWFAPAVLHNWVMVKINIFYQIFLVKYVVFFCVFLYRGSMSSMSSSASRFSQLSITSSGNTNTGLASLAASFSSASKKS